MPSKLFPADKPARDRATLDWALRHNVECGGWCPKGRKAEDGPIDSKYPLKETPSAAYIQRTEWNVRDSDATLLFSIEAKLTAGSKKTVEFALEHNKPYLHLWETRGRGGWISSRLQRKVSQAMKRKRPRVIVLDPKDLERRCAAAKLTGRQFLSTLDPEEAQALAPVFPKGCTVKTTDLIGLLESELEEIKPCGVVRI